MKKLIKKIDKGYWAFRNWWRDSIFQPIWYRVFGHKHHIVKTNLSPSPWYEADTRILYAVMAIVEWFVEKDQNIWTKEAVDEEIERIKKEEDEEYKEDNIQVITGQYREQEEIISISKWWKDYDRRTKEISKALSEWHKYVEDIAKREFDNYDIVLFFRTTDKMTEEEKAKEEELSNNLRKMEGDLLKEEQEMLKKAIDLRDRMWS